MDESENVTSGSLSQQITRDYDIIRLLGKGGMGDVYLAEQVRVGHRPVALKVLNRSCSEDPDLRKRFENEAASAGRIRHRNVVMIYESRVTDDGQLYVAMEYVEGVDLGHAIEQRKTLPLEEILAITRQAAAGLGAAHKLGIVHRDIKPANIMLTQDDDGALIVKVLDFGIARLSEADAGGAQTKTGVVMGTPCYMSPEQVLGKTGEKIDHRSDIYSLAMVVYQMLTGRVAFEADSWIQVMYKHINESPRAPSKVLPELAHIGPVDQVIFRGLEKDREKRQQSTSEFANDLEAAYNRMNQASLHADQSDQTVLYVNAPGAKDLSTVRMPGVNQTVPEGTTPDTSPNRDSGGADAKTAIVVFESLPAGSSIAYGEGQRVLPGKDGRVTIPLTPGTHEIEITDPTGNLEKQTVTITGKDIGSFKTVRMAQPEPFLQPPGPQATGAAPSVGSRARGGKRIAAVASAVILVALSAVAFVVIRGRGKAPQQIASDAPPLAAANPASSPSQASIQDPGVATVTASPQGIEANANGRASRNATKPVDEPKKTDETSKETVEAKAEPLGAPKPGRNPHDTGATSPVGPAPSHQPAQQTTQPAIGSVPGSENKTGPCLGVIVTRPDGEPAIAARVTVVDEISGAQFQKSTGQLGRQQFCGLIAGHRYTMNVVGAKGMLRGSTQGTVNGGRNLFSIQLH
ncbi:MAG TPA: protein kinase [Blastocatellia bacterium]|nr:protein kinase [Blastocatellia bacterium]